MLVGPGSGKTTTAAKLGLYLKRKNFPILLVGAGTYRPAAREQLKKLAHDRRTFYTEGTQRRG